VRGLAEQRGAGGVRQDRVRVVEVARRQAGRANQVGALAAQLLERIEERPKPRQDLRVARRGRARGLGAIGQ